MRQQVKKNKKLYDPFLWMGFNWLKATATSRTQLTVLHTCSCSYLTSPSCNQEYQLIVFSIWKQLWVLQKAFIKIMACAFTLIYFFLIHTLLVCWKTKTCDCCFLQQIILWLVFSSANCMKKVDLNFCVSK